MKSARPATAFLLIIAAFLTGCGDRNQGPQRFDISGIVTYKGQPVPRGTVTFSPNMDKGNEGPVAMARIIDGKYDTRSEGAKSPIAGELLVHVEGYGPPVPNEEVPRPLFETYVMEFSMPRENQQLNIDVPVK